MTCDHGYTGNERNLCACPSCAGLPLTDSGRARRADAAASVVHDFIYGRNGVTKKEANEAIWTIHDMLRPLCGDQGGD